MSSIKSLERLLTEGQSVRSMAKGMLNKCGLSPAYSNCGISSVKELLGVKALTRRIPSLEIKITK